MKKDFIRKNSRSILIILVLIGLWAVALLFNRNNKSIDDLLDNPERGQIYIFQEGNFYAPMRIDSVAETNLYLRNYQFLFEDAIPKQAQILDAEFDKEFYAIYDKQELVRLYDIGNLVHIYP